MRSNRKGDRELSKRYYCQLLKEKVFQAFLLGGASLLIAFPGSLPAETTLDPQKPMTIDEAIRMVVSQSRLVRLQQLEVMKSDLDLNRHEATFDPILEMSYRGGVSKTKMMPSTILQGTKAYQDRYALGISKVFKTGTYFKAEVSDERIDTNSGEGIIAYTDPLFSMLSQPPLHTGALTFVLQQELLQSGFGETLYRANEIKSNEAQIKRKEARYMLSKVIVKTMVDYWSLAIAEDRLKTAEVLLKNTRYIRGVTARKLRMGLAESFEMNQWNALLEGARSQLDGARLERDTMRMELLRTLDLDEDVPITGASELESELPENLDLQSDIQNALANRPDLQNIRLQKENIMIAYQLAQNKLLPSVTLGATYSSRDFGRHARTARSAILDGSYPESGVEFKVQYPLWNEEARADLRETKLAYRQLEIQEEQMERQVKDEIKLIHRQIQTSHQVLKRGERMVNQTERFYRGILAEYRRGKVQAETIREALDALAKARQSLSEMKINYNITLIRYELLRNNIFEKYHIDVDATIKRLEDELQQTEPG